jgi:hypothetical protein
VTVRVRNGQRLTTDGPFVETKEWMAGFDLLGGESLDQAVEVASRHPMARFDRMDSPRVNLPEGMPGAGLGMDESVLR